MHNLTHAEKTANLRKAILDTPHMMKVAQAIGITPDAIRNMINAELRNAVRQIHENWKVVPLT